MKVKLDTKISKKMTLAILLSLALLSVFTTYAVTNYLTAEKPTGLASGSISITLSPPDVEEETPKGKPSPPPILGGGGGGGTSLPSKHPYLTVRVQPAEMNLSKGGTKTFSIRIENTGTGPMTNIRASASEPPFIFTISPTYIGSLPESYRKVFLGTIEAPYNISAGEYLVEIEVSSSEVTKSGFLAVTVPETFEKPAVQLTLEEELKSLQETAKNLWTEAEWLALRGANVTLAFEYLESARGDLVDIEKTMGMLSYEKTREILDNARNLLKEATLVLGEAQPRFTIPFIPRKYMVVILLLILVILGFAYKATRKYDRAIRTYKKVEDSIKKKDERARIRVSSKKQERLRRQLKLVEKGYKLGDISKDAYLNTKKDVEKLLKEAKKAKK